MSTRVISGNDSDGGLSGTVTPEGQEREQGEMFIVATNLTS